MKHLFSSFWVIFLFFLSCTPRTTEHHFTPLEFEKVDEANPVLGPDPDPVFFCPVRQDTVHWEEKDVFNPAAVVKDGLVWLIYRAEDSVGKHNGTSRIAIATSKDGLHFEKRPEPVFFPDNDKMKSVEWEGGAEDPRVVEDEKGRYIMTYTAYNGEVARLCVASSMDLIKWEKHGLAFGEAEGGKYEKLWSKSGAIICKKVESRMVATQINGKYWMYWGDTDMYVATSDDMIHWKPVLDDKGEFLAVFSPRPHHFDSDLVEPGPPPFLTEEGILFIYNSRNRDDSLGYDKLDPHTYSAGQVLVDPNDPAKVLARPSEPFMWPEKDYEVTGQVNKVCFLEGLVWYSDKWLLYYGTADSKIAVAQTVTAK